MKDCWVRLTDYPDEFVQCGAVLRVPSMEVGRDNWYRDDIVDLMVFFAGAAFLGAGYGLMAISGYKAGSINTTFPVPESSGGEGRLLRTDWLIHNWKAHVYSNGNVEDVWIRNPSSVLVMPSDDCGAGPCASGR